MMMMSMIMPCIVVCDDSTLFCVVDYMGPHFVENFGDETTGDDLGGVIGGVAVMRDIK